MKTQTNKSYKQTIALKRESKNQGMTIKKKKRVGNIVTYIFKYSDVPEYFPDDCRHMCTSEISVDLTKYDESYIGPLCYTVRELILSQINSVITQIDEIMVDKVELVKVEDEDEGE